MGAYDGGRPRVSSASPRPTCVRRSSIPSRLPCRRLAARSDDGKRNWRGTPAGRIRSCSTRSSSAVRPPLGSRRAISAARSGLERVAEHRRGPQQRCGRGREQVKLVRIAAVTAGGTPVSRPGSSSARPHTPRWPPRRAARGRTGFPALLIECSFSAGSSASPRSSAASLGGSGLSSIRRPTRGARPPRSVPRSRGGLCAGREASNRSTGCSKPRCSRCGRQIDGGGVGPVEVIQRDAARARRFHPR